VSGARLQRAGVGWRGVSESVVPDSLKEAAAWLLPVQMVSIQ